MTLGFKTKWPDGRETHFPEKILEGLLRFRFIDRMDWYEVLKNSPYKNYSLDSFNRKIHTIRADEHDRWKPGMNIHFMTGVRTKKAYRFAPIVPVVSVQRIEIKLMLMASTDHCWVSNDKIFKVLIDGRALKKTEIVRLASNDGFLLTSEFFEWFGYQDFTGKLIHWTDKRY